MMGWLKRPRTFKGYAAWALGLLCLALLILQLWYAVWIVWWKFMPVHNTAFMKADLVQMQAKNTNAKLKHTWVNYERIADSLKRGVIASEDANFGEHEGVDWKAIQKARDKNTKRGKVVSGGSTITMQLAKNLFLSGSRSYVRKAQELVITFMLEAILDKERILEMYLNSAEFGAGVFGAEAGARHHFGVSAAQLSAEQSARLAAMLPRPKFYDRNRGSDYLQTRTQWVLRWMPTVELP
jgi:monofunctional biosynthetic peptidoglycan transglycosylase